MSPPQSGALSGRWAELEKNHRVTKVWTEEGGVRKRAGDRGQFRAEGITAEIRLFYCSILGYDAPPVEAFIHN